MTALYHLTHRLAIEPATLEGVRGFLTPSNSFSHVGDRRLRIHTWRGVPARHCDVLVDDGPMRVGQPYQFVGKLAGTSAPWLLVCDVGRKQGRFDGAERWRITFRDLQPQPGPENDPPLGRITVEEEGGGELAILCRWKGGIWGHVFPQLRYELDERTDVRGILIRQAQLYYQHLWPADPRLPGEREQVQALADEWALTPQTLSLRDINALNRDASQALYQLARHLGWRKLTLRERERLGLGPESQQWQRVERCAALALAAGRNDLADRYAAGCGDHTLDAARGEAIHLPPGVCPQCHELEEDCGCVE